MSAVGNVPIRYGVLPCNYPHNYQIICIYIYIYITLFTPGLWTVGTVFCRGMPLWVHVGLHCLQGVGWGPNYPIILS